MARFARSGIVAIGLLVCSIGGSAQTHTSSTLSPDLKWLAYMSSEAGDWQVYIQSYPGMNGNGKMYQMTKGGGVGSCLRVLTAV